MDMDGSESEVAVMRIVSTRGGVARERLSAPSAVPGAPGARLPQLARQLAWPRTTARNLLRGLGLLTLVALLALAVPMQAAHAGAGAANGTPAALDVAAAKRELGVVQAALERGRISDAALSEYIHEAAALRTGFGECTRQGEAELARINADIAAVLAAVGEDSAAAERELKPMRREKTASEGRLAECQVLLSQASTLVEALTREQNNRLAARLLARGPDAYTLIATALREPAVWWHTAVYFVQEHSGLAHLSWPVLALLLVLTVLGWWGGRHLRRLVPQLPEVAEHGVATRFGGALLATFAARLSSLLAVGLLATGLVVHAWWKGRPPGFLDSAGVALLALLATRTLVCALLMPTGRPSPLSSLPPAVAHALGLRVDALLILLAISGLLFLPPQMAMLPAEVHGPLRVTMMLLVSLNTAWLVGLLGSVPEWKRAGRGQRLLVQLVLLATVTTELLGYHNLAWWLLSGLAKTLALVGVATLVGAFLAEILDGLDTGHYAWQQRLRGSMGLEAEEPVPGLVWLRLVVAAITWTIWALIFLRIWGVSDAALTLMLKYLIDGFAIGEVRIVPSQVLLGIVLFFAVLALVRTVTRGVAREVEQQRRMDIGAREALVKSLGYVGFAIAVVVGLSTAGVDFSSFALVAGALSVGIGFGLQNVVNNFVSGLILLFERPIRTGDWIVVGQFEGIVKRISVRSTELQTFDRGDVILPNGDLISNAVKNFTLRDRVGRVQISLGVAYGSDTEAVRRLLLDCALGHPKVIRGGLAPAPWVWFIGFGESSLDFQLTAFVSEVGERMTIASDLNFAIDRRLREEGIDVPFPQRDVTVRFVHPLRRDVIEPDPETDDSADSGDGGSADGIARPDGDGGG